MARWARNPWRRELAIPTGALFGSEPPIIMMSRHRCARCHLRPRPIQDAELTGRPMKTRKYLIATWTVLIQSSKTGMPQYLPVEGQTYLFPYARSTGFLFPAWDVAAHRPTQTAQLG